MFKRLWSRFFLIAIVLLWVIWSLLPSIQYGSLSEEELQALRREGTLAELEGKIIHLGLDLQGGTHLKLEVDIPNLTRSLAQNRDARFDTVLARATQQAKVDEIDFLVAFQQQAEDHGLRLVRHFSRLGVKLPDIISALENEIERAIDRTLVIIRNRVDKFGVSEPTIQKTGRQRIIVELAGIDDPDRARDLIQKTGLLEFNRLKDVNGVDAAHKVILKIDAALRATGATAALDDRGAARPVPAGEDEQDESLAALLGSEVDTAPALVGGLTVSASDVGEHPLSAYVQLDGSRNDLVVPARYQYAVTELLAKPEARAVIPSDGIFLWSLRAEPLPGFEDPRGYFRLYYLDREPALTGGVITEASAGIGSLSSSTPNQPVVNVNMNNQGAKDWARFTGANINRRVAIVLDKKVQMAPNIVTKIPDGRTEITGLDNMDEAKDIANVLEAGALPAPVTIEEERTVGPSLGRDSIDSGLNAAAIGGLLVVIFMVIYYRASGLLATVALVFNILVVLAALASLGATLTLPGIAGLILTVGMAVDANVLIFERIREELDKGKTVRAAIDSGYGRATITIVDASVTTILAALVLFQFGTGPIKGFAITLFWGILASMFTAIFMTRTIFMAFTQSATRRLQKLSI